MADIEKTNLWQEKTLAIGLSKYVKIKALSPVSFPGKIDYPNYRNYPNLVRTQFQITSGSNYQVRTSLEA